jgi:hypothetical protein
MDRLAAGWGRRMKPRPLGTGRALAFGKRDKGYQALHEAACSGPVDWPHLAIIKWLSLDFRMKNGRGGNFYVYETGYWSRWDHARRCFADNRSHGKVRCEPDITDEQAAGRVLEHSLCQAIDAPPDHFGDWWLIQYIDRVIILKKPVLGFFVLWLSSWLLAGSRRDTQRRNIHKYRGGLAPFHEVDRPDRDEEERLFKLYQAGDAIAGNKIIAAHTWIARDVAHEYRDEAELDDLIQEGTFGLYKALKKFGPESHYRFSTLAYSAVEWAIKDYIKWLRRLQRCESSDEITSKGNERALGMYRATSVDWDRIFSD